MRILFSIIISLITLPIFSQGLVDNIDFHSINKELINNELIRMIIQNREIFGNTEMVKDTTPMLSAKYHMMYFEQYGDVSEIHDKPIVFDIYGLGYTIISIFDTPENRLFTLGLHASKGEEYFIVNEISKYYKIDSNQKITYNNLINSIFDDFIIDKSFINDDSKIKKYLGICNGVFIDNDGGLTLGVTLVIGKKN